jgi:hypothetical protein
MRKSLDYILGRFPDHGNKILDLFNQDDDFRMLCEDFLASMQGLEECRLNVIKDKGLENEFSQVHLELEKEIIHLLGTHRMR